MEIYVNYSLTLNLFYLPRRQLFLSYSIHLADYHASLDLLLISRLDHSMRVSLIIASHWFEVTISHFGFFLFFDFISALEKTFQCF